MTPLIDDLKAAFRALLKNPAFTGLSVLILALGIGANSAIFSLLDQTLLRPLPYPRSDRLVAVWTSVPEKDWTRHPFSFPDFQDWSRSTTQLEGMAAMASRAMNFTGGAEPMRLGAGRISWNFCDVVGVRPALGRAFRAEEDEENGPRVVILSHEFWTRSLGGDPGIIGRSIPLDGADWQVVGIMPSGFSFRLQLDGSDLFVPLALEKRFRTARGAHSLVVVGRLRDGASAASAQAELAGVARRLEEAYPDTNRGLRARVVPLREELVREFRTTLLVLMGSVAFVLLIACANLMNLMLARSARRERETAIRSSLGASRGRLLRQQLLECGILGLLGGGLGTLLGFWSLAAFKATQEIKTSAFLEPRVLGFTFALGLGTSLLVGFASAFQVKEGELASVLKEGAKGSQGRAQHRMRGVLVAAEMALATALLIGSGLLLRSLRNLMTVDPGFRGEKVMVVNLGLPAFRYPDAGSRSAFVRTLLERVRQMPGVVAAAANNTPPLGGGTTRSSYDIEGLSLEDMASMEHLVSPGYFAAMGIPILEGSDLDPARQDCVVVNERFARRHFAPGEVLGHRISTTGSGGPWKTIVGVVGNVHHAGLAVPPEAEYYFSMLDLAPDYAPLTFLSLLVKGDGAPEALLPGLKQALRECDPTLPMGTPHPMAWYLDRNARDARLRSSLLGGFAILALTLAGLGLYGVISFITAGRTREVGVRMALGAKVSDVVLLVLRQGLAMVLLGLGAGLGVALLLGRYLESMMVGMQPRDPLTFLGVAVLLSGVGILACLIPALRAARVHPSAALRND